MRFGESDFSFWTCLFCSQKSGTAYGKGRQRGRKHFCGKGMAEVAVGVDTQVIEAENRAGCLRGRKQKTVLVPKDLNSIFFFLSFCSAMFMMLYSENIFLPVLVLSTIILHWISYQPVTTNQPAMNPYRPQNAMLMMLPNFPCVSGASLVFFVHAFILDCNLSLT